MALTKAHNRMIEGSAINVVDRGCVADGVTDNTTALTDLFSDLGASFTGVIYIPYGVKYNFNTVAPLAPIRAVIEDQSSINGWDTIGFRQKIVGYWETGDPTAVVDLNPVVSSGHNAGLWLENRGTSGSVSGDSRVAYLGWSSGRFETGEAGIRSMSKFEWKKGQFRPDLWELHLRKYATWAAKDYEIWATGKAFSTGDYTITSGRTYVAASTGTAGSTQPTHTSGTVSDGGVNWTYVETAQDKFVFGVDEHGRLSVNSGATAGYTFRFKQSTEDSENLLASFESTGTNKTVSLRLNGTDGSGTQNAGPFLRASTTGLLELFNGAGTMRLWSADADSFDIGSLGRREVVAVDGDTTPSVAGAGVLVLANTSATSITTLDDAANTQEVMLIFENSNTTLVHSANFVLKGGVNVTPATRNIIVMKKYSRSSVWIEVSRNF